MEWIQLIISMIGIIGLILFLYYLMRKVNKNTGRVNVSRIKIIDRAVLGKDSSLVVVCVCGKLMLIGVSTGRTEKICDLPVTEEEYLSSNAVSPSISFAEILSNMGIKKRKEYKNENIDLDLSGTTEAERENSENASDCDKTE